VSKKYLMWDFDNTLAYRQGMWSQTIHSLLQDCGYKDIELDAVRALLNTGFPWHCHEISHEEFFKGVDWWEHMTSHFSSILLKLGIEEAVSKKMASEIKDRYLDVSQWVIYDDTVTCLEEAISRGYENVILSNHVPELPQLVKELELSKYFSQICTSAELGYEKPNIQIYKLVMDKLEDCEEVTMIGDSYSADIEGAINAGLKAILVRKENTNNYQKYCSGLEEIFNYLE